MDVDTDRPAGHIMLDLGLVTRELDVHVRDEGGDDRAVVTGTTRATIPSRGET